MWLRGTVRVLGFCDILSSLMTGAFNGCQSVITNNRFRSLPLILPVLDWGGCQRSAVVGWLVRVVSVTRLRRRRRRRRFVTKQAERRRHSHRRRRFASKRPYVVRHRTADVRGVARFESAPPPPPLRHTPRSRTHSAHVYTPSTTPQLLLLLIFSTTAMMMLTAVLMMAAMALMGSDAAVLMNRYGWRANYFLFR